jgi:DNA-binding protein HU-beta
MSKPMTKTQLVAAIAEATGSDKKSASATLDAIAEIVTREVVAGGRVADLAFRAGAAGDLGKTRQGHGTTGEQISKPADKVVKIAVAKALKDSVNG